MWLTIVAVCLGLLGKLAAAAEAPDSNCQPSCEGKLPGNFTSDPSNCHRYHICLQGGAVSNFTEKCDKGQLFNGEMCDDEENVQECATCTTLGCTFSCPQDNEEPILIADRHNCSKYMICLYNRDPVETSCLEDRPYFNGQTCVADASECCDRCTAFCVQRYTQIADPFDCSKYYYCDAEGYPEMENLHQCTVGRFSEYEGVCKENATCNTCNSDEVIPPPVDGVICSETFQCEEVGYFPKCQNRCDPHYYECNYENLWDFVQAQICINGRVINPDTVLCVEPQQCPYPPNNY